MDHFGIGRAMKGMARCYFQASRGTGRTTSLLENLKDGHRVCFASVKEADRLTRLLSERKVEAQAIAVDPSTPQKIFERGTPEGRTIFDESWVEQYYLRALEAAANDLDHIQRQASGIGVTHVENRATARQAG